MARQAIPADLLPPFDGFGGKGFAFLRDLRDNQDRTWFQAHRDVYEAELHAPMAALVAALSTRLGSLGLPLRGDPARAIFRINRDVRFSKDKSPYKTHVGAALPPGPPSSRASSSYLTDARSMEDGAFEVTDALFRGQGAPFAGKRPGAACVSSFSFSFFFGR